MCSDMRSRNARRSGASGASGERLGGEWEADAPGNADAVDARVNNDDVDVANDEANDDTDDDDDGAVVGKYAESEAAQVEVEDK